ncbi:DUF3047 domain-containing protein [Panacagrimonas sp.]|uniref:DUF3047 domain-containing protein n=1 Tax=Panacagrimonas sp. TaxID=2480088 RepID=UPI003B52A7DF
MPIRNAPSQIPTTLRFMGSRLAHRMRGGGHVPVPDFRGRVELAVQALGDEAVLRCDWITVQPGAEPWLDTGLSLPAGQAVSLIADGMVYASRPLDVGFEAKMGLWYRVGDSELAKIVGNASTFYSGKGGALHLTAKPPGEFADRLGAFEPAYPRKPLSGAFTVAVIQWRGDAVAALQVAAKLEPELFEPALQRLQTPVAPPPGWHYLWRLGQGEIFTPQADDASALCCHTRSDVGILQFPVDRPLTRDSFVSWSWCVEQLPSTLPEHIEPTHDYLSLAVEFDNGLDLTWMWSASLPVDTIFQCPLAWWNERETHWVVRSGTEQLGQWLDERRNLQDDYRKAIGDDLPKRVVAVWLIANTVFQRGEGKCEYRNILLQDASGSERIVGANRSA